MNKVACISYSNTAPFFYKWDTNQFPLVVGSPRKLADQAARGELIAGPLPLVECWALKETFEPLNDWGIAVRDSSHSVFLLSKTPINKLVSKSISVTEESSTSVQLLRVLIEQKFGQHLILKRGFQPEDEARLIIGDKALFFWNERQDPEWPYVLDLASEWWSWTELPFVFARWVIRRDVSPQIKNNLADRVFQSLAAGKEAMKDVALEQAKRLNFPAEKMFRYLSGFQYEIGPTEKQGMTQFETCLKIIQPVQLVNA